MFPVVSHRFHMDPSGTFIQYDAKAIGSGSEGAQSQLQEVYHKVSSFLFKTYISFTGERAFQILVCPCHEEDMQRELLFSN